MWFFISKTSTNNSAFFKEIKINIKIGTIVKLFKTLSNYHLVNTIFFYLRLKIIISKRRWKVNSFKFLCVVLPNWGSAADTQVVKWGPQIVWGLDLSPQIFLLLKSKK